MKIPPCNIYVPLSVRYIHTDDDLSMSYILMLLYLPHVCGIQMQIACASHGSRTTCVTNYMCHELHVPRRTTCVANYMSHETHAARNTCVTNCMCHKLHVSRTTCVASSVTNHMCRELHVTWFVGYDVHSRLLEFLGSFVETTLFFIGIFSKKDPIGKRACCRPINAYMLFMYIHIGA